MTNEGLAVRGATEQRFRALFAANERDLLGYALRRADNDTDAADVVAETFLVAWRRIHDIPAGSERPWLFGVASKVLDNQRRSGARRDRLSQRLAEQLLARPRSTTTPEDGPVPVAMSRLSAGDREVLCLTAWEGLTPAECGVVLGISAVTARSRLHRARRRLKDHLETEQRRQASRRAGR